jgi:hypothetical protein
MEVGRISRYSEVTLKCWDMGAVAPAARLEVLGGSDGRGNGTTYEDDIVEFMTAV